MTAQQTIFWTTIIVSFVGCLQLVESYLMTQDEDFLRIWSYENLAYDLKSSLILRVIARQIYTSQIAFRILLFVQFLAFCALPFFPLPSVVLFLFFGRILICLRFRGTVNGGSDMLFFVILTGLYISFLPRLFMTRMNPLMVGLIYIGIHGGNSYLKAGVVKILSSDWRKGKAIPVFLSRSLIPSAKGFAAFLDQHRNVSLLVSWSVIFFELFIPFIFFHESIAWGYFFLAMAFHFFNYWFFGLNRFFWTWLMAWPSILYLTYVL